MAEKEYVEREALLAGFQFRIPVESEVGKAYKECVEIGRKLINEAPAADVVEVRHGVWIYDHWCEFKCSECGHWSQTEPRGKENYCPHCGADMRGEKQWQL